MIILALQTYSSFYYLFKEYNHMTYAADDALDRYLMSNTNSHFNDLNNDKFYI